MKSVTQSGGHIQIDGNSNVSAIVDDTDVEGHPIEATTPASCVNTESTLTLRTT